MEIILICLTAFLVSILTFFSGFGLGTILMPVFAIFFPVEIAIALTGVVHFTNNIFKIFLVGRNTDKTVLLRFGIPAIAASFAGAWVLLRITVMPAIFEYRLWDRDFEVTPVKLIVSVLLIFFSIIEFLPYAQKIRFDKSKLPVGGLLSGFFGGLTGLQGAVRSAFLIKSGLSKEAYIATGVAIACLVDISRLSVYASRFSSSNLDENTSLLVSAIAAAVAGTWFGSRLLKKITMHLVQVIVAVMLIIVSIALGAGII